MEQDTSIYSGKIPIKTPHFTFDIEGVKRTNPDRRFFTIGDEKGRCLDASFYMPSAGTMYNPHVCILHQVDALMECARPDKEDEEHSFGTELLFAFISLMKANYPHLTQIRLRDTSYIPCSRFDKDTLDLLTYNIALYGKTWYEMKAGAYIESPNRQELYNKNIQTYMDPNTKAQYPFSQIWQKRTTRNSFASTTTEKNNQKYEEMYNTSKTFPDFFKKLSKTVPKEQKCKFFKGWLESWIEEFIIPPRDWVINIDQNEVLGNVLDVSQKRPAQYTRNLKKTRKARKSN